MPVFEPDYRNVEMAARNTEAPRLPLYEHIICEEVMEELLNVKFKELQGGDRADRKQYFSTYCRFFKEMGYDTVSFERCIGSAMPGFGALGNLADPVIKTREDFDKYPWDKIPDRYFEMFADDFRLLREVMPAGKPLYAG